MSNTHAEKMHTNNIMYAHQAQKAALLAVTQAGKAVHESKKRSVAGQKRIWLKVVSAISPTGNGVSATGDAARNPREPKHDFSETVRLFNESAFKNQRKLHCYVCGSTDQCGSGCVVDSTDNNVAKKTKWRRTFGKVRRPPPGLLQKSAPRPADFFKSPHARVRTFVKVRRYFVFGDVVCRWNRRHNFLR